MSRQSRERFLQAIKLDGMEDFKLFGLGEIGRAHV